MYKLKQRVWLSISVNFDESMITDEWLWNWIKIEVWKVAEMIWFWIEGRRGTNLNSNYLLELQWAGMCTEEGFGVWISSLVD